MSVQVPPSTTEARVALPRESSFNAKDWDVLSSAWFPILRSEDLGEKPVAARLLDVDLVIYKLGGAVHVARDLCPHRGAALSLGWVEDGGIVCPYHGLRYGADGRCNAIPADPGASISPKLKLTLLPVAERFGLIWTSLNGDAPVLPAFEAWDDPDYLSVVTPTIDIGGSAGRQVEGFLDVAHFAWVHTGTFADRANTRVPSYTVERTERGIRADYRSSISNYPQGLHHLAPADFEWLRAFEVFPPFSARLIVHFPEGGQLWILNAASPISARKTRLFCPIARNFDKDAPVQDIYDFNLKIFNEDRVMVESQRPEDLPLDSQMEAHIGADKSSIAYRKVLKEMGLGTIYVS